MPRALLFLALCLPTLAACKGSGIPLYQSCDTKNDCVDTADDCFTVAWDMDHLDGTMCSAYCSVHADCPGNSSCYELVGDPTMQRVCFKRCNTDFDCAPDYQCVNADMGMGVIDAICLPNGSGPPA